MESNLGFGRIFKRNKKLEYGLLAIGLLLFITLSARGLQKIDDKAVAAGDANKNTVVETDLEYADHLSAQADVLAAAAQRQQVMNQKADVSKQDAQAVTEKKRIPDNPEAKELVMGLAKSQAQQARAKQAEHVQ